MMQLEPPKTPMDALRNLEIGIQAFYFMNMVNKDKCPDGKLDRARAILDKYLNQFI